jgi:hypothetical protein
MKVQKIKELEFSGKHQLLVYADDENMLGENIKTIKRQRSSVIRD